MYGSSLKFVNSLLNKKFGSAPRRVPAHMPHMIDRNILQELQDTFPEEFDGTSSHKLRHPKDMQFAFAYFYFMMHQTVNFNLTDIFNDILDVNHDGVLDDNELRSLAVHLNDQKELKPEDVPSLKEKLRTCNPGPVTLALLSNCTSVFTEVKKIFSKRLKYKYQEQGTDDVAFVMVSTNASQVQGRLDGIRARKQKFVCLNDNMNHSDPEARKVVAVLKELYENFFPTPSQFELPIGVVNSYLHIDELLAVREDSRVRNIYAYSIGALMLISLWCLVRLCRPTSSNIKERRNREKRAKRFLNV